jgi:CheY-like chemotaxis protein
MDGATNLERNTDSEPFRSGSQRRVLVVEDEMIVAMLVEDMMGDLGFEVAGVAGRLNDAFKLLETTDFDVAVLDVSLNGELVFPFARALEERHLPFIFATAYGARGIPHEFATHPVVQKPFRTQDLAQAIERVA